jgi:hypothetical protein
MEEVVREMYNVCVVGEGQTLCMTRTGLAFIRTRQEEYDFPEEEVNVTIYWTRLREEIEEEDCANY